MRFRKQIDGWNVILPFTSIINKWCTYFWSLMSDWMDFFLISFSFAAMESDAMFGVNRKAYFEYEMQSNTKRNQQQTINSSQSSNVAYYFLFVSFVYLCAKFLSYSHEKNFNTETFKICMKRMCWVLRWVAIKCYQFLLLGWVDKTIEEKKSVFR